MNSAGDYASLFNITIYDGTGSINIVELSAFAQERGTKKEENPIE